MISKPLRLPLNLGFKGERDYLHGTDMLDATIRALKAVLPGGSVTNIDFSFHRVVRQSVIAVLGEPECSPSPAAVCLFDVGNERHRAHLEETGQPVTIRTPYPEHEIVRDFAIDVENRSGILRGRPQHTEIEIWVAMVKALHYAVFPNAPGKWLFVRGLFPSYECDARAGERQATLVSAVGERLTRTEIAHDGRKRADILFAQLKQSP